MVSEDEAKAGSAGLSGLGRNGEMSAEQGRIGNATAESINSFSRSRYSDFRIDEAQEPESQEANLLDYVVFKERKKGKGSKANGPAETREGNDETEAKLDENLERLEITGPTAACPVCGEFEGDEAAVAHHVDAHFA